MGQNLSKNTVDETVNLMTQIANSATTSCVYTVNEDQTLNISATNGSTVTTGNIDFTQYANVDSMCLGMTETQNKVSETVQNEINQIAKSITQAIDLNPGSNESNDTTKVLENLGTAVTNAFNTTCNNNFNQTETATLSASDGSTITVGVVDYSQAYSEVQKCVLSDSAVTNASQIVQNTISQKATSEVESIFGPLLFLLLIVALVVIVIVVGGFKEVTNPKFLIAAAIIIVIYLVIARLRKWWPFNSRSSSSS